MNDEKFRCQSCHNLLKQIDQTDQYYCDQPNSKCVDSLRVILKK
jgi:hypothetical protein